MRQTRREFLATGLGATALLAAGAGTEAELTRLTLREASEGVKSKAISPVELTEACLQRIERLNPQLNAYITVAAEQALARARKAEAEPWGGPLHGIPIGIKDSIDTAGLRTTGASEVFKDRVPKEDAEVVRRLKAAGAVILGKQNLSEFGLSGSSMASHFGGVHNPWGREYEVGGSSGGSAASVAAGLDFGSVATDGGGSIRAPSAWCGVVGLKPTRGRVSLRGLLGSSWSVATIGPICRTVADAAVLFHALSGYDPKDPASIEAPVPDVGAVLRVEPKGLRIGVPRAFFFEGLDPEVEAAVTRALDVLGDLTERKSSDVELPSVALSTWANTGAECYAEHEPHFMRNPHLYQAVTRRRLEEYGRLAASAYAQSNREQMRLRREVMGVFDRVDLLVTPTVRQTAPTIEASLAGKGPFNIALTWQFNTFDLPALSLPCGFTKGGLPIGLQIIGPRLGEAQVLALASAYEQATEWHERRPAL